MRNAIQVAGNQIGRTYFSSDAHESLKGCADYSTEIVFLEDLLGPFVCMEPLKRLRDDMVERHVHIWDYI